MRMKKVTAIEFFSEHPELKNYPEYIGAINFYVSDNDECPYIGVEYIYGEVWVYGAKVDRKIEDLDELEYYLEGEE